MKHSDKQLVAGFLIREFQTFAEYLDDCGFDPTTAEVIVHEMIVAFDGAVPIPVIAKYLKRTKMKSK